MSDTEKNYPGSEKKDLGRKKDGKKDKKEKGYIMFESDDSAEELVSEELKSPSKMRKGKAFRFGQKKDTIPTKAKDKEEKKEKEVKKEDKEKKKLGEKDGKRHKKDKKKSKHLELDAEAVPASYDSPVFGVPLAVAVDRNKCHDGIQLPALFRECIDYIEEHGLHCEGIYRISGVKSKVQHLKDCYNRGDPPTLEEHEPNIVASLLKQFLRELPVPVLTNTLIPKFEEASTIRNEKRRIENYVKLIGGLPECNRLLLSWMIVHMTHVIEQQRDNKMTLQNVSIVLSPTMQISHRVLNVLFSHSQHLFRDTHIKRYIPPLKPATSRWSLELPDQPAALEEELAKQESLLNQLHQELQAGRADPTKEEQIWEVQRVCTQLKRKIKTAIKAQEAHEKRRKDRDEASKRNTLLEEEEDLRLELREIPDQENLNLELQKQPEQEASGAAELESEASPLEEKQPKASEEKNKHKTTLKELAGQRPLKKTAEVENEKAENEKSQPENEKSKTENEKSQVENENAGDENATVAQSQIEEVDTENKDEPLETGKSVAEEEIVETERTDVSKESQAESGTVEKQGEATADDQEAEQEPMTSPVTEESKPTEIEFTSAEAIKADLAAKEKMLLQEDTTDSELGRSVEDLETKAGASQSSEDEFENSLEEILEKEGPGYRDTAGGDSERELIDTVELDQETDEVTGANKDMSGDTEDADVTDTVQTPIPQATSVSPPSITPVPQDTEEIQEQTKEEKEPETKERDKEEEEELKDEEEEEEEEEEDEDEDEDSSFDEEEYQRLLEDEYALRLEEEELLAIENELRKKIETEKGEIDRLHQEIEEQQYLRQDSDEDISSSSDSSYESEDEEELQDILNHVLKQNEELERSNAEMCQKIHEERMICLNVKVQIGLLQQKQLQSSVGSESFLEKDSLIDFD